MREAVYTIYDGDEKRQTTDAEAAEEASRNGAVVTATFNEF